MHTNNKGCALKSMGKRVLNNHDPHTKVKTTLRLHLIPVRKAVIRKPPTNAGEDVGKEPCTLLCVWGIS